MKTLKYELLAEDFRPQMGLVVLQSDVTLEDEMRCYFPGQSMSLLVNRIPFENEVTRETLRNMEGHLNQTMSLFPITSKFDVVGYACTSGALHIGSQRIQELVQKERPCHSVTNPMQAVGRALNQIGAKRIAYLAPYSVEVTQSMVERLEADGFDVVKVATFDESQDKYVGLISPQSIHQAALDLCNNSSDDTQIDAIFIACTNMKCVDVIPDIENETGAVVLSSNLVLAWDMARLAKSPLNLTGYGRLASGEFNA